MMKKNRPGRDELCDMLAGCSGYLKRVLAVCGADPDMQEEIAQEAIFQGYEKLHRLRNPEKMKPWLATVAVRLYARECKRSRRFVSGHDGRDVTEIIEELPSGEPDALDEILRNEQKEYLAGLVMKLSPKDSSIILLRYRDDMSLKDIAIALDMNYSTVRSMHARALAKLREIAESEKGGGDNGYR